MQTTITIKNAFDLVQAQAFAEDNNSIYSNAELDMFTFIRDKVSSTKNIGHSLFYLFFSDILEFDNSKIYSKLLSSSVEPHLLSTEECQRFATVLGNATKHAWPLFNNILFGHAWFDSAAVYEHDQSIPDSIVEEMATKRQELKYNWFNVWSYIYTEYMCFSATYLNRKQAAEQRYNIVLNYLFTNNMHMNPQDVMQQLSNKPLPQHLQPAIINTPAPEAIPSRFVTQPCTNDRNVVKGYIVTDDCGIVRLYDHAFKALHLEGRWDHTQLLSNGFVQVDHYDFLVERAFTLLDIDCQVDIIVGQDNGYVSYHHDTNNIIMYNKQMVIIGTAGLKSATVDQALHYLCTLGFKDLATTVKPIGDDGDRQ